MSIQATGGQATAFSENDFFVIFGALVGAILLGYIAVKITRAGGISAFLPRKRKKRRQHHRPDDSINITRRDE